MLKTNIIYSLVKRYFDKNHISLLKTQLSLAFISIITAFIISCYYMTISCMPLIGISLNTTDLTFTHLYPTSYLTLPKNLTTIIKEAGGIPIAIPPSNKKNLLTILKQLDGIILYRDSNVSTQSTNLENTNPFKFNLLQTAWEKNIPLLAIASGAHDMTLFLKGQLYHNLAEECPQSLPHIQLNPPYQGSHCVHIQSDSFLYTLTQRTTWMVNSFHQQGIKSVGQGIISAVAEDKTIEAIEDPSRKFFLGVQWHPEFAVDYTDRKLFSALITKAKIHAQTK